MSLPPTTIGHQQALVVADIVSEPGRYLLSASTTTTNTNLDDSPEANNHSRRALRRMMNLFRDKLALGLQRISSVTTCTSMSTHNNAMDGQFADTKTEETGEIVPFQSWAEGQQDKKQGSALNQNQAALKQAEKFYTVDTEAYNFSSVLSYYATKDSRIQPKMMKFFIGRSSTASRESKKTDYKNSSNTHNCCVHPLLDKLAVEFCHRAGMLEVAHRSAIGERMFLWLSRNLAQRALCGVEPVGGSFVNWVKLDSVLTDLQCLCARLAGCVAREGQFYPEHCCSDPAKIQEAHPTGQPPSFVCVERQEMCRHVYLQQDFGQACTVKGCPMYGKRLCSCFQLHMFIPDTIALATKKKFEEVINNLETNFYGEQRWMLRASSLKGGNGVQLIDTAAELETFMRYDLRKRLRGQFFVLQRVPRSPMLYEGKRFELRMFLLLAVLTDRRVVAFVHPGFLRLAQMAYSASSNDLRCHLAGPLTWDPDYNFYKKSADGPAADDSADYCVPYSVAREQLDLPDIGCDPALDAELRRSGPGANQFLLRLSRIVNCIGGQMDSLVSGQPGSWQVFGLDLVLDSDRDVWLHDVVAYPGRDEPDPRSATQCKVLPAMFTESLALVLELNQRDRDTRSRRLWLDLPDIPVNQPGLIAAQKNFMWMYSTDPSRLVSYKSQRKRTKPPHWYNCWRITEDFNDYILYLKNHRLGDLAQQQADTDNSSGIVYGRRSFGHSAMELVRRQLPRVMVNEGGPRKKQEKEEAKTKTKESEPELRSSVDRTTGNRRAA